ncbi:hypothetical protein [Streptomyces sp. NBC_01594]|uniref:hypothetical protein n=1 Tax=Streptomyces sp. NBC_01594 TaxID=2975890 RepID=UPI003870D343
MSERKKPFRPIRDPFVVQDATGVAIRTRLKDLAPADDKVIRLIGAHMGGLAAADLALYSRAGFERNKDTWAGRKQSLTAQSSSRWAGAVTKGTHDQYALARRGQFAYRDTLYDGIRMLLNRLSLPVGEKGTKGKPGGYRSQGDWFHKSRRLNILHARLAAVEEDIATGRVHVVRGGKKLARNRHNLAAAGLTEAGWRDRWEAARWFLSADGESGKRFGNETIRVTPDGEVSIKLPKPLEHLANAPRGRYVLSGRVSFAYRGDEWADRPHLAALHTDDVVWLRCRTAESDIGFALASRTVATSGGPGRHTDESGRHACPWQTPPQIFQALVLPLDPARDAVVDKTVALYTSRDPAIGSPLRSAVAGVRSATEFAELLASHHRRAGLWRRARIEVPGEAGRILRLHLFHVLQTLSPHTAELDVGVPARGLHGEAYRGHVFWDELFVLRFLSLHFPEVSRGLLDYRYRRLPARWLDLPSGRRPDRRHRQGRQG